MDQNAVKKEKQVIKLPNVTELKEVALGVLMEAIDSICVLIIILNPIRI